MKKTKLIMTIVATTTLASTIVPTLSLSSCSCSEVKYNEPELSSKTPKVKEVSSNSSRTYFLIEQKNIKQPEATKVKMTNLVVNGTSVTSVAGIIKSTIDSAGNIRVSFNMALVQKHYQAESITFDLVLTNKEANTSYTLTGFEVKVVATASGVEYDIDEDAIELIGETSVTSGQDLNVSFTLDDEYEFNEDYCDVTVNDESVKDEQGVTFDLYNGSIIVPASLIPNGSEIKITLSTNTTLFYINKGLISLTNKGKAVEGELKVPETFKGQTVKGIAVGGCINAAFSSITFEKQDNINTFSTEAFAATANLTSIEIPKNVTVIGAGCFMWSGLQTVTFEANSTLTTIGNNAFNECSSLASVQDIPTSVTSIGYNALAAHSSSFKSIGFVDSENWFQVSGARTLVATDKDKNAEYFNTGDRKKSTVPDGTNWAATGLIKQKTVSITGTHQIDVSDETSTADFKVEFDGVDVTADCTYYYSSYDVIVDPAEHKIIQAYPGSVSVPTTETITAKYTTSEGKVVSNQFDVELATFSGLEFTDAGAVKWDGTTHQMDSILVPSRFYKTGSDTPITITTVAENGFKGFTGKLILPDTITTIGKSAFENGYFADFTLPSGVTSIGDSAFKNNIGVNINVYSSLAGLKTIGANAFDSTQLSLAYVNASIESIGDNAFANVMTCVETMIDSQTIVHLKNNNSKVFFDIVYIKDGLEDPVAGDYIYDNYEKGERSDPYDDYWTWTLKY